MSGIYIYIYTHIHTHTHIYIYIYIFWLRPVLVVAHRIFAEARGILVAACGLFVVVRGLLSSCGVRVFSSLVVVLGFQSTWAL